MERRTDEGTASIGSPNCHQPRIVIVGAGAAGLAAAQQLMENGLTNFIILEAMDRVGGRVWTMSTDEGHIEMGAQFLHGKDVFYEVADKNKIIRGYQEKEVNPVIELGSGGEFLTETDLPAGIDALELFNETYLAVGEFVEECKYIQAGAGIADDFEAHMETRFEQFLREECQLDTPEIRRYRLAVYDWIKRSHRVDNACVHLKEVSTMEYAKYAGGLINLPLTVPMGTALGLCALKVPRRKVFLNTAVVQIKFCRDLVHPVQITCANGQVLQADHCIVTASLGFLKKNSARIFKPSLPAEKVRAITKAGFGTVDKIFLRFDKPFWQNYYGTDVEGFQLLFDNHDASPKEWHHAILGFDISKSMPNTLVGWVAGQEAEKMESLSDEEVMKTCHALLSKFMKGVAVPFPVEITRPNWYSNSYTCGSYSYAAVGQSKYIEDLAQPIWFYRTPTNPLIEVPGLMFAGEATHPTLFSTIPGALESGRREANRLIIIYSYT